MVLINHDQTRPDHAFAMSKSSKPNEGEVAVDDTESKSSASQIPCVMISWNSGQAILEDKPERLRLYPGGGRPFIESVSDDSPVVYIIHNLLTEEECNYIKSMARGNLKPAREVHDEGLLGNRPVEREFNTAVLHHGIWKSAPHKAIDEKLLQIINSPSDHFADLQVFESNVQELLSCPCAQ